MFNNAKFISDNMGRSKTPSLQIIRWLNFNCLQFYRHIGKSAIHVLPIIHLYRHFGTAFRHSYQIANIGISAVNFHRLNSYIGILIRLIGMVAELPISAYQQDKILPIIHLPIYMHIGISAIYIFYRLYTYIRYGILA